MLVLSPEILRRCYAFLDATEPYSSWNLPDADDVVFKVVRSPRFFGWYKYDGMQHTIAISQGTVKHTMTLLKTMAHEMVHMFEGHTGMDRADTQHGRAFRKLGEKVAKIHGFDPGEVF